jgi:hypothetical protein
MNMIYQLQQHMNHLYINPSNRKLKEKNNKSYTNLEDDFHPLRAHPQEQTRSKFNLITSDFHQLQICSIILSLLVN